jgi:hypothetical protein
MMGTDFDAIERSHHGMPNIEKRMDMMSRDDAGNKKP